MWGCGLKFIFRIHHTDYIRSPPMWGCGLKYFISLHILHFAVSPPMWGCGLKSLKCRIIILTLLVTPYVGVWIEIQTPKVMN